jgi:predicted ester cyclase
MMTRTLPLLIPLAVLAGCATPSQGRNLSEEAKNKRLVQAFAEEVYAQHQLGRIPRYVAEDFVDLSEGAPPDARGPAYIRAQEEASLHELPGLQFRIQHLLAEGDLVHLHWTAEGPVATPLEVEVGGETKPPPLQLTGHTLFQVRKGRIVASWSVVDTLGLLLQQGFKVLPPVPAPPPRPPPKP